mgnify:CR=1 FL=1
MSTDNIIIEALKKLPLPKRTYLGILRVHEQEVPMANLLAYYFRPNEEHGLGDLFIRSLLATNYYDLDKGNSKEGETCNQWLELLKIIEEKPLDFSKVKVSTEVTTKNSTDASKYIDILIETEEFVICIEFKINHKLNNPLETYQKYIEEEYPKKKKIFIVLTPTHKAPSKSVKDFKGVVLSHFIKKVTDNLPCEYFLRNTDNIHAQYFTDFIQTIRNRGTRVQVEGIVKKNEYTLDTVPFIETKDDELGAFWVGKIAEYKLKALAEQKDFRYHNKGEKKWVEVKKKGYALKIRIEADKWKIEKWPLWKPNPSTEYKKIKDIEGLKYDTSFKKIIEKIRNL